MYVDECKLKFLKKRYQEVNFEEKVPGKVIHTHNTDLTVKNARTSRIQLWVLDLRGHLYSHAPLAEFREKLWSHSTKSWIR